MKLLVPGRFTTTSIKTPDGGELEVRLTDGGHWQMKAKLVAEKDWRPLCRGHIDGSIVDAARPDDLAPVKVGPLLVDPAGRRVEVRGGRALLGQQNGAARPTDSSRSRSGGNRSRKRST